jgi:hypothetical protein
MRGPDLSGPFAFWARPARCGPARRGRRVAARRWRGRRVAVRLVADGAWRPGDGGAGASRRGDGGAGEPAPPQRRQATCRRMAGQESRASSSTWHGPARCVPCVRPWRRLCHALSAIVPVHRAPRRRSVSPVLGAPPCRWRRPSMPVRTGSHRSEHRRANGGSSCRRRIAAIGPGARRPTVRSLLAPDSGADGRSRNAVMVQHERMNEP